MDLGRKCKGLSVKKRKIVGINPQQMDVLNKAKDRKIQAYANKHGLTIEEAKKQIRKPIPTKKKAKTKKKEKSKKKIIGTKLTKIKLISKRGTRVAGKKTCDRCHKEYSSTWRYAESNLGTVFLCTVCKETVRKAKKFDVMKIAYTGGRTDGNRG